MHTKSFSSKKRIIADEEELPVNDELFLSPIQKYKIYGKFPYKMLIHSLLLVCTSFQVILLITTHTNYTRAQERLFYDAFVTESDKTKLDIPRFKYLFTIEEFHNHFNQSITNFYALPDRSLDQVNFIGNIEPKILMKISYLKTIDDITKRTYTYEIKKDDYGPMNMTQSKLSIQQFLTNITKIELNYSLQTIVPTYYGDYQDCYIWTIDQVYSFLQRGHITTSIQIKAASCDLSSSELNHTIYQTFIAKFLWLHIIVLFLAVVSLILIIKYFFNMFKLYWRIKNKYISSLTEAELENLGFGTKKKEKDIIEKIKESYKSNQKKKEKTNSFFNQWSIITLIGNIIQIMGSGLSVFVGEKALSQIELLIGLGCLFSLISVGKYMQTIKHCAIIYNSIQNGLPNTMRIFVGVLPVFLGFNFFAICTFWRCERFASINDTVASLYAIMNGDVMLDVLNDLKRGNYLLGQIFGYVFCILFVVVVMNVFLSVIGEAYVKSKMTDHNHWIYSYMKLGEGQKKEEVKVEKDKMEYTEEDWKNYIRRHFKLVLKYMKSDDQIRENIEDLRDKTFEELIDLKQRENYEKNETLKKQIKDDIQKKLDEMKTRLLQLKHFNNYINRETISINNFLDKLQHRLIEKKEQ